MSDKPVVLVVDDRPENLLAVEGVLQQLDITIEKALRAEWPGLSNPAHESNRQAF